MFRFFKISGRWIAHTECVITKFFRASMLILMTKISKIYTCSLVPGMHAELYEHHRFQCLLCQEI